MDGFYDTPEWAQARDAALARDGSRCLVARLLGGPCEGVLHVHHIVPIDEGGPLYDLDNLGTVCARHHPRWEKLARQLRRSIDLRVACECGVKFRRPSQLDEHRRNVHGVGVPDPDWDLNRAMAAEIAARLGEERRKALEEPLAA